MKLIRWLVIPVVIVLGAALWVGSGAPVTAGPSPEALAGMSPQTVTGEFYAWYLDMLGAEVLCNPLLDGTYRDSPYLSAGLVAALDALVAACDFEPAVDPLLCTADAPHSVGTRIISTDSDTASVLVYGRYLTEDQISETRVLSTVGLVRAGGHWALDSVTCR